MIIKISYRSNNKIKSGYNDREECYNEIKRRDEKRGINSYRNDNDVICDDLYIWKMDENEKVEDRKIKN